MPFSKCSPSASTVAPSTASVSSSVELVAMICPPHALSMTRAARMTAGPNASPSCMK